MVLVVFVALVVLESVGAVAPLDILTSSAAAEHLNHALLGLEVLAGWGQRLDLALAGVAHVLVWIVHIVGRHELVVGWRAAVVVRRALKSGMAQLIVR